MTDHEPTVRSRELGERLREAINKAGYSPADTARMFGWSHGRVSRCCPAGAVATANT